MYVHLKIYISDQIQIQIQKALLSKSSIISPASLMERSGIIIQSECRKTSIRTCIHILNPLPVMMIVSWSLDDAIL